MKLARVYNSSDVQKKLKEYEAFFENLRIVTGKKKPIILDDVLILHNNLDVEQKMSMKLLPWMIDALHDPRLKVMRQFYYTVNGYNEKLRRLLAGYLIRQINDDMTTKSSNKTLRKVGLYSGHDKNLIGVMQALNIYDSEFPEFGSALIFELLSINEEYYVKILHHLGIPEEIETLTLPGCEALCPLNQYLNLTKSAEIPDDEMNCNIKSDKYFDDTD